MDKSNATIEIYILYCCDIWKTKPMHVKIATTRTQRLLGALCKCIIAKDMEFEGYDGLTGMNLFQEWADHTEINANHLTANDLEKINNALGYGFIECYNDGEAVWPTE